MQGDRASPRAIVPRPPRGNIGLLHLRIAGGRARICGAPWRQWLQRIEQGNAIPGPHLLAAPPRVHADRPAAEAMAVADDGGRRGG